MDPIALLLETASRRFGAARAQQLVDALRRLIGDERARSWAAWLGRRGFWADFAMQAIASLRPGHALERRHVLPTGLTAAQVDELWEEFVEGLHRGLAALPAPGGAHAAPGAPAGGAHAAPAALGWTEELGMFLQELPRVLAAWLAGAWPWLAGACILGGLVFLAFALKSERQVGGWLHWLPRAVVADTRTWFKFAKLVTTVFLAAVLLTLLRSILTAPAGRFFQRGRLLAPVGLALAAIPTVSLAFAAALDTIILAARLAGTPLPLVLPFVAKADRYAMLFATPAVTVLLIFVGVIFLLDKVVDIPALIARRFGIGRGNVPLEVVGVAVRNFGLAVLAGLAVLHLAICRWPSAQQVADFLLYGLGLVVLSGIILAWAGIRASAAVHRAVVVIFILVVAVATVWVWYHARHPGLVEGVAASAYGEAAAHRPWYESLWAIAQREWVYDVALPSSGWEGWLRGLGKGVVCLVGGVIVFGALALDMLQRQKGWSRIWAIPLALAAAIPFAAGLFHCVAIVWGWAVAL